jgi:hypothetical protein
VPTMPTNVRHKGNTTPGRTLRLIDKWAYYLQEKVAVASPLTGEEVRALIRAIEVTEGAISEYGTHMYERAKGELVPLFGPGEADDHK